MTGRASATGGELADNVGADENPDGSRTYRWRVRLADFDQKTGVILSKLDRIDYHIEFER